MNSSCGKSPNRDAAGCAALRGCAVKNVHATPPRLAHAAALLALGAGSQLTQVVLVRELLMVFHGNELSIGIAMASWLLWVGLGSLAATRIPERVARTPAAATLVTLGLLAAMPATLLALRRVRDLFGLMPGEWLSFVDALCVSVPALAPACLLWGAQFVLLARLWQARPDTGEWVGGVRAYAGEAFGNLLGGLAFSLLLVHVFDAFACLALAGLLMALATAGLCAPRSPMRRVLLALSAVLGAALPLWGQVEAWSLAATWRHMAPDASLVETRRSRYGLIAVMRRGGQYSFYQSGQLAFSTGAADVGSSALEEQEAAVFTHLALAQHPAPRRALLIGGGLRGVLREMLAHPLDAIDYIELDPALIEAARDRVPPDTRAALDDSRVRVLSGDGRLHIKTTHDRYDVILVDVPDPSTAALNRFYTVEFFHEARQRLFPGGVLVVGADSTAGLRDTAAANRNATLYHTLRREFAHVLPVGDRFLLFFATDEPDQLSADPRRLRDRHRERGIESPGFSDALFFSLLQEAPLRRTNWILRRHGREEDDAFSAPDTGPLFPPDIAELIVLENDWPLPVQPHFINSDFRPVGYYHTLVFWNRHARGRHGAALERILRLRTDWLVPILGALLLAGAGLRMAGRRAGEPRGRRFALGVAVWTTGFSTMATQLVLLFSFQSQYGFVYEMIGLIVAVFMGGLATGAIVWRARPTPGRLAALQLVIALWALVLAAALPAVARLTSAAGIFALYGLMTFLAGLWNGFNLPLALGCARLCERRAGSGLGALYGMELLGACAGALLAGVALVPVLGMAACCRVAAALNVTAGAVIWLAWRQPDRTRP